MKTILRSTTSIDLSALFALREELRGQILNYSRAALIKTNFVKTLPGPEVLDVYVLGPCKALVWVCAKVKPKGISERPYLRYSSKLGLRATGNKIDILIPYGEYASEEEKAKLVTALSRYAIKLQLACTRLGIEDLVSFSGDTGPHGVTFSLVINPGLQESPVIDWGVERDVEPKATLTPLLWNYVNEFLTIFTTLSRKVDYDLEAYCCKAF